MDAGFATLNSPLSKLRDRFVAVLTELRADTARWYVAVAMYRDIEQVLRLFVCAVSTSAIVLTLHRLARTGHDAQHRLNDVDTVLVQRRDFVRLPHVVGRTGMHARNKLAGSFQ